MIITKAEPYSTQEIEKLKDEFGSYIKTVIDIGKKSMFRRRKPALRIRKKATRSRIEAK